MVTVVVGFAAEFRYVRHRKIQLIRRERCIATRLVVCAAQNQSTVFHYTYFFLQEKVTNYFFIYTKVNNRMVYGILGFNVPLDTV